MPDESLSKAIRSLAYIKVSWYQKKEDYIQSFIPFLCTLIIKKNYTSISSDPNKLADILDDFKNEFGLIISYHALVSILERAKNLLILEKKEYLYYPTNKIFSYDIGDTIKDFSRKYEKILESFINFAKTYNENISIDMAEEILVAFLKQYDLEIIFVSYDKASLPDVEVHKKGLFLFSKFIEHLDKEEPRLFQDLVDIAVGHSLSNIINYGEEFDKASKTSLKGINIYLDTRFIFRLIGAEGEVLKTIYSKISEDLSNEGVNLFVFNHTHDEISGIMQNCLMLIDNIAYDPIKASFVLRYFKEKGFNESDILLFISKIEVILNNYKITIKEGPDPNQQTDYQIDEEELKKKIIKIYGLNVIQALEKDYTIVKDVLSISYIYKLRAGKKSYDISQAKNLFVTTNSKLAYASKIFERQINGEGFYIPVTITDVFLGTILWLRKPEKLIEDSQKRLLAKVYAAINPNEELLKRFINEINRLKKIDEISEDDYILLRDSQVARRLLAEETLGDPDKFTPKTPIDILEEIEEEAERKLSKEKEEHEKTKKTYESEKIKIQEDANKRLQNEREEHDRTKKVLENEKAEKVMIRERINKKADKIANILSWSLIIIFLIVIIFSYLNLEGLPKYIIISLSLIPILFGFLGITINTIKEKIKNLIIKGLGLE